MYNLILLPTVFTIAPNLTNNWHCEFLICQFGHCEMINYCEFNVHFPVTHKTAVCGGFFIFMGPMNFDSIFTIRLPIIFIMISLTRNCLQILKYKRLQNTRGFCSYFFIIDLSLKCTVPEQMICMITRL